MVNIIVASHGKFAEELVNSSYMVFGKQENVSSIGFFPGEGTDNLRKKYEEIMQSNQYRESVILVDILGGSPFNVAVEIASKYEGVQICTGVNFGMLIEAYSCTNGDSAQKMIAVISDSGKNSITVYQEAEQEDDDL